MTHTATEPIDLSTREKREQLLRRRAPSCLIIKASLRPIGDLDRFQPAGFPEIGHVIYDAPRSNGTIERVCIVDSPASMANHLESVCMDGPTCGLHADLAGLPYVRCITDANREEPAKDDTFDNVVCTSLTEGHRLASDYFLDGVIDRKWVAAETRQKVEKGQKKDKQEIIPAHWSGKPFREALRSKFDIIELAKDKTYFIPPQKWWSIYRTIFDYDPNSLIHGIMFTREQIKISRFLTAHLEAFGASRVGSSGVKFDPLGRTKSGQPIFAVDDETANEIRATFILDLALLRSYGRDNNGLSINQKILLFDLAIWKIGLLLGQPFRFRTGCFLFKDKVTVSTELGKEAALELPAIEMITAIEACGFGKEAVTDVYYPSDKLYKSSGDVGESEGEDRADTQMPEDQMGG
jgi:CRISPR-associated protein Csb1